MIKQGEILAEVKAETEQAHERFEPISVTVSLLSLTDRQQSYLPTKWVVIHCPLLVQGASLISATAAMSSRGYAAWMVDAVSVKLQKLHYYYYYNHYHWISFTLKIVKEIIALLCISKY